MAANDVLESLQRRLQTAHAPVLARHAVAGIFTTLRKYASSLPEETRSNAISYCLSRPNKVHAVGFAAGRSAFCAGSHVPCLKLLSSSHSACQQHIALAQVVVQEAVGQLLSLVQAGGGWACRPGQRGGALLAGKARTPPQLLAGQGAAPGILRGQGMRARTHAHACNRRQGAAIAAAL